LKWGMWTRSPVGEMTAYREGLGNLIAQVRAAGKYLGRRKRSKSTDSKSPTMIHAGLRMPCAMPPRRARLSQPVGLLFVDWVITPEMVLIFPAPGGAEKAANVARHQNGALYTTPCHVYLRQCRSAVSGLWINRACGYDWTVEEMMKPRARLNMKRRLSITGLVYRRER